jgi:homoserine kinase
MRARAPASAANLGPGFDVLAVALDLYVEVEVEPAPRLVVRSEGEGADLDEDDMHLAARVAIDVVGHDRLAVTVRSDIPVGRGLGSSAALAVAAAAAAGSKDPLGVAARIDGHPENAAASTVGGLVAATLVRGAVRAVRMPLDGGLVFVAMVPDRPLPTTKARQALPQEVSRTDATFNLGRLSLLLAGLADRSLMIREATEDRLHQDYRSPLFPEAPQLLARMLKAGALASCWSGAGPSLLGICDGDRGEAVRAHAEAAMEEIGVPGRAFLLRPELEGLIVEGSRL